jgi:hypothetical protein
MSLVNDFVGKPTDWRSPTVDCIKPLTRYRGDLLIKHFQFWNFMKQSRDEMPIFNVFIDNSTFENFVIDASNGLEERVNRQETVADVIVDVLEERRLRVIFADAFFDTSDSDSSVE